MRIVDRKTFLAMPAGTVYFYWSPDDFLGLGEIHIKGDSYANDWIENPLTYLEDLPGEESWRSLFRLRETGTAKADFFCTVRNGMYEENQQFAVLEADEVRALIARFQLAYEEGYQDSPSSDSSDEKAHR